MALAGALVVGLCLAGGGATAPAGAARPDDQPPPGYWLVAADGGVFTFGDAGFYGALSSQAQTSPTVGMAATPDGGGY
ncbi:MAG TPA: hypothetical protein VK386_06240, partial [Acidimicrobiales bacterium]|nr:hypothetical protein [Acidimicrobiales bacterium]